MLTELGCYAHIDMKSDIASIDPEKARQALAERAKGGKWVPVDAALSRCHPLCGFGGWLVLVQIYFFVSLFAHVLLLVVGFYDLFVSAPMQKGGRPSADYFTLLFFGYSVLIVVLFSIALIFLYTRIFAAFVATYALTFALKTVTLTTLIILYGGLVFGYATLVPIDAAISLMPLLYALFSVRANVTIGSRLRHNDNFWHSVEDAARQ